MTRRAIVPRGMEGAGPALQASPGIVSHGHLFVTGMTGASGSEMPADPAVQFEAAFDKIGTVLAEAGAGWDAVVEMTSYHIDIAAHFDAFREVRARYVGEPWPAWTAVEVARLRRPGALVEIRVIAALP